ncbi:MAG: hypothetical protein CMJ50_01130 [Planctomycetaceae bacterium]|jgi:hypothetical protein|nr:hypothetical protein [Planctomycetaceae bacterium]
MTTHEDLGPETYGYPPALAKACVDPFDYAMKLETGELIFFEEATPHNFDWVYIRSTDDPSDRRPRDIPLCDRGLFVRVSSIVWVADAPNGS